MAKLPKYFFNRDTRKVAQMLLGQVLIRKFGKQLYQGIITETEAYFGPHDLASHASKGRSKRTETMFGPPGVTYIYLIYGMYYCFNIVTEREGYPAAVLIRSCQPIKTYKNIVPVGPGKLCQAFRIDKKLNNQSLFGKKIWIRKGPKIIKSRYIKKAKRIGVDYAGMYKDKPWRYYLRNNKYISG